MNTRLIVRFILDQVLNLLGVGVVLFWSAGRLTWWSGWAVIAVWTAWFAASDLIMLRTRPDLMAERLAPPREAKRWDKVIVSLLRLVQLIRYILAGLDQRYGWTVGFPFSAQIAGLVMCVLSFGLFGWAMACNPFFSQVVRIQSERGHAVVTGGPYRYVRHPGYVGTILFELAVSTLLGSWPALIAGAVCALLWLLRTALEDRTLQKELAGYTDYARQVRFRLLPGLW